ncbi:hypothetical protein [Streptomyces sp. NPDC006012]|uniref:hypothetical protein n=1 Tax=Streptomyces sp. NPDC006012 TaxID=3364739 RepID=UPI0036882CE7
MANDEAYPKDTRLVMGAAQHRALGEMAHNLIAADSELGRESSVIEEMVQQLLEAWRQLTGRSRTASHGGGPADRGGYAPGPGGYAPGQGGPRHPAEMSDPKVVARAVVEQTMADFTRLDSQYKGFREAFEDEVLRRLRADKKLHRAYEKSLGMPFVRTCVMGAESRERQRNLQRAAEGRSATREPGKLPKEGPATGGTNNQAGETQNRTRRMNSPDAQVFKDLRQAREALERSLGTGKVPTRTSGKSPKEKGADYTANHSRRSSPSADPDAQVFKDLRQAREALERSLGTGKVPTRIGPATGTGALTATREVSPPARPVSPMDPGPQGLARPVSPMSPTPISPGRPLRSLLSQDGLDAVNTSYPSTDTPRSQTPNSHLPSNNSYNPQNQAKKGPARGR